MISKNKQKLIRSLTQKKNRDELNLFIAEGHKVVEELLPYFSCRFLAATSAFWDAHYLSDILETAEVSERELAQLSLQKSPQQVLALFQKKQSAFDMEQQLDIPRRELVLALDCVQDPGNLGTIVRIADWFGIRHVFCSLDTADVYSPKTVQSTMGSLGRVCLHYLDLAAWMANLSSEVPVYGTFLEGDIITDVSLTNFGVVVMGNEGNGIRPEIERLVDRKLFIPRYPAGNYHPESLNVAVSTAIVCQEFRRTE